MFLYFELTESKNPFITNPNFNVDILIYEIRLDEI